MKDMSRCDHLFFLITDFSGDNEELVHTIRSIKNDIKDQKIYQDEINNYFKEKVTSISMVAKLDAVSKELKENGHSEEAMFLSIIHRVIKEQKSPLRETIKFRSTKIMSQLRSLLAPPLLKEKTQK